MRDGLQLFSIDYNVLDDTSIKNKIKSIKIIIKSAFGGDKTYINQIMLYENTIQEMNIANNNNESMQSININNNNFQQEINLPEDLSNSQISINSNEVKKIPNKKFNDNIRDKKDNLDKKIKKKNIVDYISETNSKHSDIKCILMLFNLQSDKLTKSAIECLKKYMQIFSSPNFWEHVLIIYTKSYRYDEECREKIENTKGSFLRSLRDYDCEELLNFMKKNNIKFPQNIPEFFVDSKLNLGNIDSNTREEYRKILYSIKVVRVLQSF